MKKSALLTLLALTGCSATASTGTTLAPLPTTGVSPASTVVITLPGEEIPYTRAEFAFFDDVYYFYNGDPNIGNEDMLEFGYVWCALMNDGMTNVDVVGRINEGASDDADRLLHFSVVLAGIENLCPSQKGEAWYIENNFPNT